MKRQGYIITDVIFDDFTTIVIPEVTADITYTIKITFSSSSDTYCYDRLTYALTRIEAENDHKRKLHALCELPTEALITEIQSDESLTPHEKIFLLEGLV